MGHRTTEAQARLVALRTAYEDAFRRFSEQVRFLQSMTKHPTQDRTVIERARRQVEQARSVYHGSRESLAQFILSRDMRGAAAGSLAFGPWENTGQTGDRAEERCYRAEQ